MTTENSIPTAILHEVFGVYATQENDVYRLDVDLTDTENERYRCFYISTPGDEFGLAPTIRQWLIDNEGDYEILPYVAPTDEQIRAGLPSLTSRQFWRAASSVGITKAAVIAAVEASTLEDKEDVLIEISESSTFERLSPYIIEVSVLFGLDAPTLDSIWSWAATI